MITIFDCLSAESALIGPDGVAPSRMVYVSASVNLPLHIKVQKFSSGTGSPRCPENRAIKWLWCVRGICINFLVTLVSLMFFWRGKVVVHPLVIMH